MFRHVNLCCISLLTPSILIDGGAHIMRGLQSDTATYWPLISPEPPAGAIVSWQLYLEFFVANSIKRSSIRNKLPPMMHLAVFGVAVPLARKHSFVAVAAVEIDPLSSFSVVGFTLEDICEAHQGER